MDLFIRIKTKRRYKSRHFSEPKEVVAAKRFNAYNGTYNARCMNALTWLNTDRMIEIFVFFYLNVYLI